MISFHGQSDKVIGALVHKVTHRCLQYVEIEPHAVDSSDGWLVRVKQGEITFNMNYVTYVPRK